MLRQHSLKKKYLDLAQEATRKLQVRTLQGAWEKWYAQYGVLRVGLTSLRIRGKVAVLVSQPSGSVQLRVEATVMVPGKKTDRNTKQPAAVRRID